jgi:competence protein ComEA
MPARMPNHCQEDITMKTPEALFRTCRAALAALLLTAGTALPLPLTAQPQQEAEPAPAVTTVNINEADAPTLASALTGVGVSRAEAIVRYRELYGPFETLEELTEVAGIGPSTLERNRERITLD